MTKLEPFAQVRQLAGKEPVVVYDRVRALEAELEVQRERLTRQSVLLRGMEHLALWAHGGSEAATSANDTSRPEYDPHLGSGDRHDWALRRDPARSAGALTPFEVRPEDEVLVESRRAAAFLEAYGLLTGDPDFAGAVEALNATAPMAELVDEAVGDDPAVSIIIPVHGQLAYTLNCLHSLLRHRSSFSFEIIVADDKSPDATGEHLPHLRRIRLLRLESNLGFVDTCNLAAGSARGRWVVMLNNDTRVVEGWLDELIGAFERFPRAGLIGSKLLYPDGSLQEAGGVFWRDGSAWNYGRGDDPNRPEYCYARQVDYVSGASIALPTELWRRMGGFDPLYRPAYAEDADLAFRVRAEGLETWFQPTSRVIHYEGRTSGTDLTQGAKAHQVTNLAKLLQRWRGLLAEHELNGVKPWLERDRAVQKRMLVIEATTLTPDQDAGSVYCLNIIKAAQELGYKIVFAPLHDFLFHARYTRELQRMGVECLYAPYTTSLEQHLRRAGDQYDVVHVFRPAVLQEAADLLDRYCPQARLIYNNHDLHYLRLARQAVVEDSPELAALAPIHKAQELEAMKRAEVVCTPSQTEKDILDSQGFPRPTIVMPFAVTLSAPAAPFADRTDVVFLGGYNHPPNADAALWLAEAIWPRVRRKARGSRLVLAGARPPVAVLGLSGGRVQVPGRVNDLRPLFERCRVFVAPLRYGAGVKGKILTAMAHGVPVITTSVGAEGIRDGLVLVADDAATFAERVLEVYGDQELWTRLSEAALTYIAREHSLQADVQAMRQALALAEAR